MNNDNTPVKIDDIYQSPISISYYIRKKNISTMNISRYHVGYKLYFVLKGSVVFIVDNKQYYIKKDQYIIIPPYAKHRTIYSEYKETLRCEVQFMPDGIDTEALQIIQELANNNIAQELAEHSVEVVQGILNNINKEQEHMLSYSTTMIRSLLTSLLIELSRNSHLISPLSKTIDKNVLAAIEYINENYANTLKINELSQKLFISERTLYRKFKADVGLTIGDFITHTRVNNAKRLLKETDMSITDIAYMCGFNDGTYFSTVFKKQTNTSPRHYRSQTTK